MILYQNENVTLDEYFKIRESSDALLEYIDGLVYMSPSPSTRYQRISRKLERLLESFLDPQECELFDAAYDIELKSDKIEGSTIVIPDISIICDKSGFTDARYIGVPRLIVEILSPSNQSHDLITKLNTITVYSLNVEGMYEQHDMKKETGIIHSKIIKDCKIKLEDIF